MNGGGRYCMAMMAFFESKWCTRGVWCGACLAASTKPWTSIRARSFVRFKEVGGDV